MVLKRVKYVGREDAVEIEHPAGQWQTVKRLGHIDVPTKLAGSLLEQEDNWQAVDPPAPTTKKGDD